MKNSNQNISTHRSPWAWVPTLYFAEGLPYVAVMTVSLILYKQMGLSNADITFYTSWLYLPWVIKPLWSPLVDLVRTKRWWILAMQLLIGAALGGIAFSIPTSFWLQGSLCFFWLLAFSSATHDIAADGFYMLGLNDHQQATFVGIRSTFYRIATIVGQGLLIMFAGFLQSKVNVAVPLSWSLTFYGMAALFVVFFLWHSFALPHAAEDEAEGNRGSSLRDLFRGVVDMLRTFVCKFPLRETIFGIIFMLCYRMPEGLLAKVSGLFLIDDVSKGGLGLTPFEFGLAQGTVGIIGLTLGGILGGIAAGQGGLKKWLWPMVCAITLPDLVYVYMSYVLPGSVATVSIFGLVMTVKLLTVNICVFIEQFGYGFGFTAYMLYLIYYSRGEFKTSHYALCTAFMALSMMIPGLFAGALEEAVGYKNFFIIVMICCAMTFIVSAFIKVDPEFGKKQKQN